MKIGAQEKKKVIIMAVLLVIAVPMVIYSYSSLYGSPSAPAAVTAAGPEAPAPTRTTQKKAGAPKVREGTLDPTLNTNILAASQKIVYNGGQRNIFKMYEPPPPPPEKPIAPVRPQETYRLPEQPQKPPIPLTFYGFSNRPGEPKKAFLRDNENIFVAVEGDVVERRYKILKITNTFILVEDVLNNNQQTINLTLPQSG